MVAYGALVPPAALEIPAHGWVNLHFSLLPAWRGAAPVQHAVLHGDEVTGASVFELEAGLDTGPVYGTLTEEIRPTDTSGDLLERLAAAGAGLLVAVLDAIEAGTAAGRAAAGRRRLARARRSPSRTPRVALGRAGVRGRPPDPRLHAGARRVDDVPRRPAQARPGPARCANAPQLKPGELLVERTQVLVGTATTPVALGEVRAAGKKPMPAADWARGASAGRADSRATHDRAERDQRDANGGSAAAARRPAGRAGRPLGPGAAADRPAARRPTSARPGGGYEAIAAVHRDDAYANLVLPEILRDVRLHGRDAAFATELTYGTLRALGTLDVIVAAAAGRDVARIDPPARDALRLGAYQLLYTRVPAHAAVSTDRRPGPLGGAGRGRLRQRGDAARSPSP